jgi:hypothetical protein
MIWVAADIAFVQNAVRKSPIIAVYLARRKNV